MGLIRIATVVAVGVALLPSDQTQQTELYGRAANAAKWTLTFCERNEATCTQTAAVWDQFKRKAEFSAKLAYDMSRDTQARSSEELPVAVKAPIQTGSIKRTSNTLTNADRKPEWRGITVVPPAR